MILVDDQMSQMGIQGGDGDGLKPITSSGWETHHSGKDRKWCKDHPLGS